MNHRNDDNYQIEESKFGRLPTRKLYFKGIFLMEAIGRYNKNQLIEAYKKSQRMKRIK